MAEPTIQGSTMTKYELIAYIHQLPEDSRFIVEGLATKKGEHGPVNEAVNRSQIIADAPTEIAVALFYAKRP